MRIIQLILGLIMIGNLCNGIAVAQDKIIVDVQKRGHAIPPSFYGIFFEEINHAGDGGLYGELVQNRSFEDLEMPEEWYVEDKRLHAKEVIHHFTGEIDDRTFIWPSSPVPSWSLQVSATSSARMSLTKERPKFETAPTNLKVVIDKVGAPIRLVNDGFWGMGICLGQNYQLRTIIRTSKEYKGTVLAKLLSAEGKIIAMAQLNVPSGEDWADLKAILCAERSDSRAKLVFEFDGEGTIWLDYVSLFPKETYLNRPYGFRKDVAQMLVDLKPAFIRWPGGSIVGGITLGNRFEWKKTLGDPASRPGEYITWGYRCSYGMGYYEMLQFCEDIGAKAMFVCNVGLSDLFRSGEACIRDSIPFFLKDCMDAIEYALGDVSTEWGARRAADGHPDPFPLEYVELGNEHWGEEYDYRFDIFYKAIKKKYPHLTLISNHPLWGIGRSEKTDMVDPHWYGTPEFFFRNTMLFDSISRGKYNVYVGEYACNFGVGTGNMKAALAEAAFIGGMERNSDLVKMTSFAPLLQNRHKSDWPVNLIWLDTDKVVGRSSYYVQKMVSENRPTYNVKYQYTGSSKPVEYEKGKIGFGSSKTPLEIKDIRITMNNRSFKPDLSKGVSWRGEWQIASDMLMQSAVQGSSMYVLEDVNSNDFTLECKARKSSFKEGFFIYFCLTEDEQKGFICNIGCWDSNTVAIEQLSDGHNVGAIGKAAEYSISPRQWYNLKLVVTPKGSILYIDGKEVLKHIPQTMPKQFIASGIDEETGELILKVVNRLDIPYSPGIEIKGVEQVLNTGKIISLSAKDDNEENSFEEPRKIYPKEVEYNQFSETFSYEFAPYSYTILRIRVK
ncbi:hypothetical protein HMPREF9447_03057 [Bacteroides oleiciplenus YIT 12058]|uniref:non-reducing end alpha-L-arabinofuranosidase n=2 Tax=Bacteroides oleiciplenus TaxID=626931 RepID=K9DX79_9BACE|nr:hypothetical protein HMPREF9447_03057 [Bacteroides oleiciplenus YIT 12058]